MNILIISFDADPPYMGGTATIANILAKNFIDRGHFCALGYFENSEHPSTFFKYKVKITRGNREEAEKFFLKYQFDVILDQLANITDFNFLRSLPLGKCKIISAYHNRPMIAFSMYENLTRIYRESEHWPYKIYTLAKIPLLPYFWLRNHLRWKRIFRRIDENSDRIIVLSKNFFKNWIEVCPSSKPEKLIAIGNPLVFDEIMPIEKLEEKEKLVIVVCSVNPQKRAHLLLKIWKEIEKDKSLTDWKFEFIGGGEGFNQIQKLAKKLKTERIVFKGFQNPLPYYRRASLMMMTSKYEGWPMVLMEGQQMGVVPVSYNSFESISDIISNGINGVVVTNNDFNEFVNKMKMIMKSDEERIEMAKNAIEGCTKFEVKFAIDRYLTLFEETIAQTNTPENQA